MPTSQQWSVRRGSNCKTQSVSSSWDDELLLIIVYYYYYYYYYCYMVVVCEAVKHDANITTVRCETRQQVTLSHQQPEQQHP